MNENQENRPLSNEVKKHFLEIVSTYNKYQEMMDRKSDLATVAETLGGITEAARTLAIHEGDDWFDKHTIKRNMSELEKLGKEFDKCAVEATSLDQRLGGLYEDMGNILSRYYKMGDITEEQMKERLGMNESVGCGCGGTTEGGCGCGTHTNESVNEAKFKVLASFGGYDLIEAPTEKDMIISKNGKKVGKLTKISKYLKDDIKSFINMVKSGKLGESVNEAGVNVWYFYKKANKDKNKFFKMLSDFRKKHSDTEWIKMLNYALEDFNENPTKYKTIDDKQNILFKNLQTNKKVYESVNEGISVFDERHFGKKGIIIMIDDNGKKVSAIFKDKKNADKYNRNNPSDIQALLKIAKTKPFGKAIDESVNEEKPGLWANIRAKQKRGEKPAHKNSQAHKDAVKAGKEINNEAKFGYKDSTASYINKHKDEYKQAEKMNNGNEKKFYDMLQQMEEKVGHGKTMLFISNALRGYGVDMFKDPKIKNPQDAQEALFLLSK